MECDLTYRFVIRDNPCSGDQLICALSDHLLIAAMRQATFFQGKVCAVMCVQNGLSFSRFFKMK